MKLKNLVNIGGVSLLVNNGWENLTNAGGRELTVSGSCKIRTIFANSKRLKIQKFKNFEKYILQKFSDGLVLS